jgi:hypothetical protein
VPWQNISSRCASRDSTPRNLNQRRRLVEGDEVQLRDSSQRRYLVEDVKKATKSFTEGFNRPPQKWGDFSEARLDGEFSIDHVEIPDRPQCHLRIRQIASAEAVRRKKGGLSAD